MIATKDGEMSTFIVHPERDAPHPIVFLYMDLPGIREELRDMARRLATTGYFVMLPNLYYRSGVEAVSLAGGLASEEVARVAGAITIPLIMEDTRAMLDFAATQPAAGKGPAGAVGYCMSGTYAINAAATFPDRILAAASIYGVRLVTKADDSPHRTAAKVRGEIYVGAAEIDSFAPLDQIEAFRAAVAAMEIRAEVEIYPGVHHGFAFPQREAYDKPAAERHWERLHALFARNLRPASGPDTTI